MIPREPSLHSCASSGKENVSHEADDTQTLGWAPKVVQEPAGVGAERGQLCAALHVAPAISPELTIEMGQLCVCLQLGHLNSSTCSRLR